MFKLFKRKNKIKELETRILVIESNITKLNAQKEKEIDFSKTFGEGFNLKGFTIDGGLIKNAKFSADKVSCGNCDKEVVVPLENTRFIDELAKKVSIAIEKCKESQSSITILNTDGVEVFKSVSGNVRTENISPKANRTIIKVTSSEGNESILTFENGEITLSVNKPELKEQSETNRDLILQIDGEVVGKVALNQLNKMQRQCGVTVTPV